jgi:DNA repair exonuclease SbcCD ATPase subunit
MDHMKLSDELRQQLMESAAWGKAGISPLLSEETVEEAAEEAVEAEEVVEEATAHVCPLCVSELPEAIDEERILEHLNVVVGLVDRLSQLNEGDEDIDTVIDETIAELLFQDSDEE